MESKCNGCGKKADEIDEYIEGAKENDMTVEDYVSSEEGTYNHKNGHFLCTDCYIESGMPSLPYPKKWVAP